MIVVDVLVYAAAAIAVVVFFQMFKLIVVGRSMRRWQTVQGGWVEDDLSGMTIAQRRRLDEAVDAMCGAGFEPVLYARNTGVTMMEGMVYTLAECRSKRDPAIVAFAVVIGFRALNQDLLGHSFEFSSKVGRGGSMSCTNTPGDADLSTPDSKVYRFAEIRDPAALCEVHRRLLPRYGGAKAAEPASVNRMNDIQKKAVRQLEADGKIEVSPDGERFRYRWGHALSAWKQIVPGGGWWTGRRSRGETERLLAEIGMEVETVRRAGTFKLPGELKAPTLP
jgi:hypothetical protein